jgi:UDP-N-acetylglucosamine 1-carboxyvinyltransferase
MQTFLITGQQTLSGEIRVAGAKNAALKALAASLMLDGTTTITNVPQIEDIHRLVDIMRDLGIVMTQDGSTYTITNSKTTKGVLDPQLHQKIRSSVLLVGPMLIQHGQVFFPHPGGCVIGKRPIDFFLDGFSRLGVTVETRADGYMLTATNLRGNKIVFPRMSVTGTEAMMTMATRVPGVTTIVNAAMEPEIPALADFLNSCGAKISGAGTPTITITGVDSLTGGTYHTMPDRIEAGTFAALGAVSRSALTVGGINPNHLEVLWSLLAEAGVNFTVGADSVTLKPTDTIRAIPKNLVTHEYPGLPTDLQAPLTVLMTQAQGSSLVFETIYEGRLFYVDILNSMGANILMCDPHRALVTGPTPLQGKKIASPDIRAGIALVMAGLIAEGQTEIANIYQIDRGYERIEERLRDIGAKIERVTS